MENVCVNSVITLEVRAVACRHWRWMPGMVGTLDGERHVLDVELGFYVEGARGPEWHVAADTDWTLDLSDPATRGCILALVREAWGDPTLVTYHHEWTDGEEGWAVLCDHSVDGMPTDLYDDEGEALVAVLEAAGGEE